MQTLTLPPLEGAAIAPLLPPSRTYVIVGANGAGKSRFMERLARNATPPKQYLSPLDDGFPFAWQSVSLPGDKRLREKIAATWRRLFPGSGMLTDGDGILFSNLSDEMPFGAERLSRGEKAALYFLTAAASAPPGATLFVDSPSLFLHPTAVRTLWKEIIDLRADCCMVFDTSDPIFASSLSGSVLIWIRSWNRRVEEWDYEVLPPTDLPDDMLMELLGSRRPVLFIEGDATHSIDSRLYSAIFPEYTVKPVGSCNRVIEATRTFGAFSQMHRMESHGLVDRDRRSEAEVSYLRYKGVMVPEVAEVENIFLSEPVIRIMAEVCGRNPEKVVKETRRMVVKAFSQQIPRQALEHTRHIMKRDVERKIDARFTCITALELHIKGLITKLRPRDHYNRLRSEFERICRAGDYAAILRVFNMKAMLPNSGVAGRLGFPSADHYVEAVIRTLRGDSPQAMRLRKAIRDLFPAPASETERP